MQQLEIFLFVIWFIFHLYREYKKCPSSGLKTQALNLKNHTYKHQHISIGDTHTHTHTYTFIFSFLCSPNHALLRNLSFFRSVSCLFGQLSTLFLLYAFVIILLSLFCPFSIFYRKSFWNGNHAITLL